MSIKNDREYRSINTFGIDENDTKLILRGTPIVFNSAALMWEYDGVKYYEVIERDALKDADTSDFIFNFNHRGRVYARTKNGSLKYEINDSGMNCVIELNSEDVGHNELYRDIKSKLIDKMSFAFSVSEDKYNKDTHTRTITKIKKLYDISAVDFAAYNDTSISARNSFQEEFLKEVQERHKKSLILQTYF